jgi:hypothetical protein
MIVYYYLIRKCTDIIIEQFMWASCYLNFYNTLQRLFFVESLYYPTTADEENEDKKVYPN